MKNFLVLIAFTFFAQSYANGQCTNTSNNIVDLQVIYTQPVTGTIYVGQSTEVEIGTNNNTGSVTSTFVPANECWIKVKYPAATTELDINTLIIEDTGYPSTCSWSFDPPVNGEFKIYNNTDYPVLNFVNLRFKVTGTNPGFTLYNLQATINPSDASLCDEVDDLDNTATGTLRVIAPLPITLTSFRVTGSTCDQINLIWKTAFESNIEGYEVERSYNGKDFVQVGSIRSKNIGANSTGNEYPFIDKTINKKVSKIYYRLKINDKNGEVNYSEIVNVAVNCEGGKNISVSPNPASTFVDVKLNGFNEIKDRDIYILDVHGRILKTLHFGTQDREIVDISDYPAGVYFMKVANDSKVATTRIVKIR